MEIGSLETELATALAQVDVLGHCFSEQSSENELDLHISQTELLAARAETVMLEERLCEAICTLQMAQAEMQSRAVVESEVRAATSALVDQLKADLLATHEELSDALAEIASMKHASLEQKGARHLAAMMKQVPPTNPLTSF